MVDLERRCVPLDEITGQMVNAEDLSRSYPRFAEFLEDAHSRIQRMSVVGRVLEGSNGPSVTVDDSDKRLLAPILDELGFEVIEVLLKVGQSIKRVSDLGDFLILPVGNPHFQQGNVKIFNISSTDDFGTLSRVGDIWGKSFVETRGKSYYSIMADNDGKVFVLKKRTAEAVSQAMDSSDLSSCSE